MLNHGLTAESSQKESRAMVLIIVLYVAPAWLVFSKLEPIRWGWVSVTVTALIGLGILGVFVALFNNLTLSGRIAVGGRVVDVDPQAAHVTQSRDPGSNAWSQAVPATGRFPWREGKKSAMFMVCSR